MGNKYIHIYLYKRSQTTDSITSTDEHPFMWHRGLNCHSAGIRYWDDPCYVYGTAHTLVLPPREQTPAAAVG